MTILEKKQELYNDIGNLREQLIGLINLCKELGNNDYENNVLVKDTMKRLQKKEQELKELRELEKEEN